MQRPEKIFEPDIEEIIKDPITGQVMQQWKVREPELRALLREAAHDIRRKSLAETS